MYPKKEIVQDYIYVDEFSISKEQYDNLKINEKYNTISKTRYIIPYGKNLKIELDGTYSNIMFAKIEFNTEEESKNISIPVH